MAQLDHLPFLYMMDTSLITIADSRWLQEEAPSLGKPVLLMRDSTKRPEAIEARTVKLVGANADRIYDETILLLNDDNKYKKRPGHTIRTVTVRQLTGLFRSCTLKQDFHKKCVVGPPAAATFSAR